MKDLKKLLSGYKADDCQLHKKEVLYHGFFSMERYSLSYKSFDGSVIGPVEREIFERGMAAAVIPYDPVNDKLVLIEQFRPGCLVPNEPTPWSVEIVAGIIDAGEDGLTTVKREMVEETGLALSEVEKVYSFFTTPGGCTERIDLFVGRVDASLAGGIHGLATEGESIRVFTVSPDEALEMCNQGLIRNAIALVGIQYLYMNRSSLKSRWECTK